MMPANDFKTPKLAITPSQVDPNQDPHAHIPYCIAFDSKSRDDVVLAVSVNLEQIELDMTSSARVDLCAHPLYRHLESYVIKNLGYNVASPREQ